MTLKQMETLDALLDSEGYVVEVGDQDLAADLVDLTASASFPEEETVIPLTLHSAADAARKRVGSALRWTIGYELSVARTRKEASRIALPELGTIARADQQEGRT